MLEACVVSVRSSSPPVSATVSWLNRLFTWSVPVECVTVKLFGGPRMQAFDVVVGTPFGFQFWPAFQFRLPAPPSHTLVQPAASETTWSVTLEAPYSSW